MKVTAKIHSKDGAVEEVEILKKPEPGENRYIVRTADGVVCAAIYNIFAGLYYADDKYGIIGEEWQ
jgi:hypothetical protein